MPLVVFAEQAAKYSGQRVRVSGFASMRFERTALFPTEKAAGLPLMTGGAVWLLLTRPQFEEYAVCHGRDVIVSGIASPGPTGPYRAYEAGIQVESIRESTPSSP